MAQARVRATGELVDVIPKPKDGILHMYDVVGKVFYTWADLEPVKVKSGLEPVSVVATQVNVKPTVTGSITIGKG